MLDYTKAAIAKTVEDFKSENRETAKTSHVLYNHEVFQYAENAVEYSGCSQTISFSSNQSADASFAAWGSERSAWRWRGSVYRFQRQYHRSAGSLFPE